VLLFIELNPEIDKETYERWMPIMENERQQKMPNIREQFTKQVLEPSQLKPFKGLSLAQKNNAMLLFPQGPSQQIG
jgi:hypothetical protein